MTKASRIQYLDEKVPELGNAVEFPKIYKSTILELFDSNPSLFVSKDVDSVFGMHICFYVDESVAEWRAKLEKEAQDNAELVRGAGIEFCSRIRNFIIEEEECDDDSFLKQVDLMVNDKEWRGLFSAIQDDIYGKMLEKPLNKVKELYSY